MAPLCERVKCQSTTRAEDSVAAGDGPRASASCPLRVRRGGGDVGHDFAICRSQDLKPQFSDMRFHANIPLVEWLFRFRRRQDSAVESTCVSKPD